jgi:regulatory protein
MLDAAIYEKLSSFCAYQERCKADVLDKLYKLKVPKDDFDVYLAKLQDQNFLNEERYTKAFISAHSKKKWGKTKIKSALSGKRIDGELIKKYLDLIEEADYDDQIKELLQKKWKSMRTGTPKDKKNKLIRFLLSKGFEMGKVMTAVKGIGVQ